MQNGLASISKLVDKGYDINLVSFEFDIPVQRIIDYRRMIQIEQAKDRYPFRSLESKMQIMRRKYYSLMGTKSENKKTFEKKLTEEENKQINSAIVKIEECVGNIHDAERKEKRKYAVIIVGEIKKILDYNMTINQIESLLKLLNSNELNTIPLLDFQDKIHFSINSVRRRTIQKYVETIDYEQATTNDLDRLQRLEKKLMSNDLLKNGNILSISTLRSQITAKIERLKKQSVINNLRENVPESMSQIISEIADGTVDIEKARRTIEEEAINRVESKPKTKFSLTVDQEKSQIAYQIRRIIVERADKYKIKNPELFLKQLREVCNLDDEKALSVLIRNFINRKEYNEARKLCDTIPLKDEKGNIRTYLRTLRKEIVIAELSDTVLKSIKISRSFEEENACFEFIKEGLRRADISPRVLILSKSDDGMKSITLEDVWPEELQRSK